MARKRTAKHPTALRVRDGFIAGAGARIYYKTLCRGVPLLLLHGGPGADHTDFLRAQTVGEALSMVLIVSADRTTQAALGSQRAIP
jgi:hypothetical protein